MNSRPVLSVVATIFLILSGCRSVVHEVPKTVHGEVIRHVDFAGEKFPSRHLDVWLPETFSEEKKYAVLYMHDGQMLYDPTLTWNGQAWRVDSVIHALTDRSEIRDVIVVGIWNDPDTRASDYFPQKVWDGLSSNMQEEILSKRLMGVRSWDKEPVWSDHYLRYLVHEVKPFIDSNYPTLSDRENTFVAGSSRGGLISIYALCEYPDIFAGAACLSTHWPGFIELDDPTLASAFQDYLEENLPTPGHHKIYFDLGTATLDSLYPEHQQAVDAVMKRKGYADSLWITRTFEGDEHCERDWSNRLHIPLQFLLGHH